MEAEIKIILCQSLEKKPGSVCSPPEDPLLTEDLDRFLSLSHKSDPLWQFPSLSILKLHYYFKFLILHNIYI